MSETSAMTQALGGFRVVELSTSPTGAQIGQFLADYGADVILVEPPGGSPLRRQPAFPAWGRGKRSIELDLDDVDDRGVLKALVDGADILVETFAPATRERKGLSPGLLAASNPRLIHASVTGFGSHGPLSVIKGYEAIVMAKVGGLSAFSGLVKRPGPAYVSTPFASWSAVQSGLHGILAAAFEREASGLGQHVEVSLAHSVGALDPWGWMVHWLTKQYPDAFTPAPPVGDDGTPNSSFTFRLLVALTADGRWMQFSQVQPRLFRAFMRALGLEWMFDDPKWKTAPEFDDAAMRVEFWNVVLERARTKTLAEWQEVFAADRDVWAEVFRRDTELLYHAQMLHNDMVTESMTADGLRVRQPGGLVRVDSGPAPRTDRPAPGLNQDADSIRAEIGKASQSGAQTSQSTGRTPTAEAALPLAGVTVLELGGFYAAPFGATLLSDFGARVIKVEPLEGDPMRSILPFPESGGARVLQGKESVAIDMGSDRGRRIIYELAQRSDIVLQCFRAGVAERLGVDAASLRAVNPDLVYLNAPGYGIDGPNGHCPAFAPTIGAGAGFGWRNAASAVADGPGLGLEDVKKYSLQLRDAAGPQFAQADGVAAVAVATGLLLGLVCRRRDRGASVMMTTMLSSAAHALSDDMIEYDGRASIQMPDSEFYGLGALYRLYQASDGWVFLAAPKPNEWDQLVDAMRVHVDLQQADFATPSDRRRNDVKLSETLGAAFVTRSGDDWEGDLVEAGIACVKVAASPPEANYLSAMGRDNGYVSDAEHPVFGLHPRLAPLVEFSRSMTVSRPGCVLGQHTESVLREIGYVSDEIELMSANGVIVVA